jgi:hypothetical protein
VGRRRVVFQHVPTSLTLAIAGLATAAAIAVTVLFPVPYVILTPGPTLNT